MSDQDQWYFVVDTEDGRRQDGPVPADTLMALLSAEKISPETLVWREGMADWEQICAIPDFAVVREPEPPAPLPEMPSAAPPGPEATVTGAAEAEAEPADRVTLRDFGAFRVCFAKARDALVIVCDDERAGPLELTKLDLLGFLMSMENASREG